MYPDIRGRGVEHKEVKYYLALWVGAVLQAIGGIAWAEPNQSLDVTGQEQDELMALMSALDEETNLATRTRMNVDFVPGMITVLHGEELLGFGIENLSQALNMVAGFNVIEGNNGEQLSVVRGIGATLNANNLKFMLNGVPVNSATDGLAEALMALPLQQIDRIEVIRGPGSSLYGEFAFSGVVNVITRQGIKQVSAKAGSHDHWLGSFALGSDSGSAVQWNFNAALWDEDNSDRISYGDNFAVRNLGYTPGNVHDHNGGGSLLFDASFAGYLLRAQYISAERGVTFGSLVYTPLDISPMQNNVLSLSLDKTWAISSTLNTDISFSWLQNHKDSAVNLPVPAGAMPPGTTEPLVDEQYRQDHSEDETLSADWRMNWQPVASHQLLAGLGAKHMTITDSSGTVYVNGENALPLPESALLVDNSAERTLTSIYLQDQWAVDSALDVTFGLRYDHYDDWGGKLSPRMAAVWRMNDRHMVKAQYAEAFRPPTLAEAYPGPLSTPEGLIAEADLDAESLKSLELAYVYHGSEQVVRMTLFNTQVSDLIEYQVVPGRAASIRNQGKVKAYGAELEWQRQIGRNWELLANLSYLQAKDDVTGDDVVGVTEWMANTGIKWHTTAQVDQGLLVQYRGQQQGYETPFPRLRPEQSFPEYFTMDYTLQWHNLAAVKGLKMGMTVKNLLDEEYSTISLRPTFPKGLPQYGRTWWAEIAYEM